MTRPVHTGMRAATGSLLISGLLVAIGVITLYDTLSYSDVDSKVFPRAAAILLIIASIVSIVLTLLRPVADEGFGSGSWWRRALLVVTLLGACLLMPRSGFLLAGAVVFAGAMIAAMHERWHWQRAAIYSASGLIVVAGFYALFRFGLNVPLP